jgi:hypothetical protein
MLLLIILIAIPWIILSCRLFEQTKQESLKQLNGLTINLPANDSSMKLHIRESEILESINNLKKRIIYFGLLEGIIVLMAVGTIGKKILTRQNELHALATTDALTGVANRLLFQGDRI